eukprot:10254465-Karenia_brevis.AAC.1
MFNLEVVLGQVNKGLAEEIQKLPARGGQSKVEEDWDPKKDPGNDQELHANTIQSCVAFWCR